MFYKGKSRWFLIAVLAALFLARLSQWRAEKERVESFCSRHSKANAISNQEVSFEGEPFPEVSEDGVTVHLHRPTLVGEGAFPTKVVVRELQESRPVSGRRVRISGPVKCERRLRNPGRQQDGEFAFFIPEVRLSGRRARLEFLPEEAGFSSRAYQWTRSRIDHNFKNYPGLHPLVTAVWTGREEGLPEKLLTLYRDLGLLPVLALSGQHVLILTGLATVFLMMTARLFFSWRHRGMLSGLSYLKQALPLVATMTLYFTSAGVPSMRRTAGMVIAVFLLRLRGIYSSKLQTCLSTLGLMLLWNPHEMLSVGFLLSGIFTAFTIALAFDWGVRRFVFSSLVLPVLGFPVTAFFFSKIAWLTIPAQLTLGLIWELGWIPIAFLLPLGAAVLPHSASDYLFATLEPLWLSFVALQLEWLSPLSQTAMLAPRPTWLELGLVEALFLYLVLRPTLR